MNIIPLKGVDDLQFGATKSNVKQSLGEPDEIENLDANDGVSSEIYVYKSLGLDLYFDKDTGFRLWGISITDKTASLNGIAPIGLSEQKLLSAFPELELDVCNGEFKEYVLPKQEIEFYLKTDYVQRVMVNPNLEDYCDKFSEQA